MGNHDVGRAMGGAAKAFWLVADQKPSKEVTLQVLETVGERYRGADAEFDDELWDHTTALGRMVAIAFDATPQELSGDEDAWFDGPCMRFRNHFRFC